MSKLVFLVRNGHGSEPLFVRCPLGKDRKCHVRVTVDVNVDARGVWHASGRGRSVMDGGHHHTVTVEPVGTCDAVCDGVVALGGLAAGRAAMHRAARAISRIPGETITAQQVYVVLMVSCLEPEDGDEGDE